MKRITNNFTGPVYVAGVTIAPGQTHDINSDDFNAWAEGAAARSWLDDGVIAVERKTARTAKATAAKAKA